MYLQKLLQVTHISAFMAGQHRVVPAMIKTPRGRGVTPQTISIPGWCPTYPLLVRLQIGRTKIYEFAVLLRAVSLLFRVKSG